MDNLTTNNIKFFNKKSVIFNICFYNNINSNIKNIKNNTLLYKILFNDNFNNSNNDNLKNNSNNDNFKNNSNYDNSNYEIKKTKYNFNKEIEEKNIK